MERRDEPRHFGTMHSVVPGVREAQACSAHWCDDMSVVERLWYGDAFPLERALATVTLGPVSLVYGAIGATRNALFDAGLLQAHRVSGAKVISVGNLVVGGSGKTPLVIFLSRWGLAAGRKVAVLSRGYGRSSRAPLQFDGRALPPEPECGDEPRLIARSSGATVFVDADRVASARRAVAAGFDTLILDDGFQHRRLAREVDVLIRVPEASTAVLPLGPGREFSSGARRATVVWNGQGGDDPAGALVVRGLRNGPASLRGQRVVALAGIARPKRFFDTLERLGAQLVVTERFPDHHRFTAAELARFRQHTERTQSILVTTEKDAERLPEGFPATVVETELSVTQGLETLARAVGWPSACAPVPSVGEAAP